MSQSINFKGMLRKAAQEQAYPANNQTSRYTREKQNAETSVKDDPYRFLTSRFQKTSQQYQKGQLKGLHSNMQPDMRQAERIGVPSMNRRKNRNSSYCDVECDEEIEHPTNLPTRTNVHQPQISLLSSNNNQQPSLFQSKLYETKDQLCEQISEIEKRIQGKIQMQHNFIEQYIDRKIKKLLQKIKQCKTQYTGGFNQIVNQLNTNIESMRKKNKLALSNSEENNLRMTEINDKLNKFMNEVDQKLERLLNSDVASSIKRSTGQNQASMSYAGDYALDLKNSINEISCQNINQGIGNNYEQIKLQTKQMEQEIKKIKFELLETNTKMESLKLLNQKGFKISAEQKKQAQKCSDVCIKFQQDTLKTIKNIEKQFSEQLAKQSTAQTLKLKEFKQILQSHQQNIIGINNEFTKVTNQQIFPRIRKLQQANCQTSSNFIAQIKSIRAIVPSIQDIKKEVLLQIQPAKIIKTKKCDEQLNKKLQKLKSNQNQNVYLVDQDNFLLDCYGNYLLNGNNTRLQLTQSEMYYLMSVQELPIKSIA